METFPSLQQVSPSARLAALRLAALRSRRRGEVIFKTDSPRPHLAGVETTQAVVLR